MSVKDRAAKQADFRVTSDRLSLIIRGTLGAAILAGVIYYAMFRLPFRFPPQQRLWSASYAFGFNNTVAVMALALLLGLVAILCLFQRYPVTKFDLRFQSGNKDSYTGISPCLIALVIAGVLYGALTFAMYRYYVSSAPPLMWEVRHLLYRSFLLDAYGRRPYIDFQAEYGPLLVYAPSLVYRVLKLPGASLEQAYFIAHFLLNLGGLWCAYYLVSRADMPVRLRVIALLVVAFAGFAPCMGLSGVLLRYLSPFACLLAGHVATQQMLSGPKRLTNRISLLVIILLLLSANILLSPEAGAAFATAWIGYGMLMLRRDACVMVVSFIAFAFGGLLCWVLLPSPYYSSLFSFSKGANNLPLVPVPHLIFYILTLFLVVPRLLNRGMRQVLSKNEPNAAIGGAFGGLCILMAFGALGRCDLPHVLFYGMGASLLLMIGLANFSAAAFTAYVVTYAAIFIGLMQIVNLQVFYRVPVRSLASGQGLVAALRTVRHTTGTERLDKAELSALDRLPKVGLPFASFEDPVVEKYLLSRRQVEPDYYTSVVGVYTTAAIERELRDIGASEYLFVPSQFATLLSRDPCAEYVKNMKEWFLYSGHFACRENVPDPFGDINRFVAVHYAPIKEVGSWTVLRRKDAF